MGAKSKSGPNAEILSDARTSSKQRFSTALVDVMEKGTVNRRCRSLNQLIRQRAFFKSEEGKEKRRAAVELLKGHFSPKETPLAVNEAIVGTLTQIAKEEEVRSFMEKIVNDEEVDEIVKDDAEMGLRIWDAQHNDGR